MYDIDTFQSTLTDTSAAWPIDSLAGMFVKPDTESVLQYLIVSNTDTTIMIWCDLSDSVITGDSYDVYDYHLQAASPCIDAGDNTAVPPDTADLDDDGDTAERIPLDLDANSRFVDFPPPGGTGVADPPDYPEIVDMGAYELQIGEVGPQPVDDLVNVSSGRIG